MQFFCANRRTVVDRRQQLRCWNDQLHREGDFLNRGLHVRNLAGQRHLHFRWWQRQRERECRQWLQLDSDYQCSLDHDQ